MCFFFLCSLSVFQHYSAMRYVFMVQAHVYSFCAPDKTHGCEKSLESWLPFTHSILLLKPVKTLKPLMHYIKHFTSVRVSYLWHVLRFPKVLLTHTHTNICMLNVRRGVIKAGSLPGFIYSQRSAPKRGCATPGRWSLVTTEMMTKFCTTGSWRRRGTVTSSVTSFDGGPGWQQQPGLLPSAGWTQPLRKHYVIGEKPVPAPDQYSLRVWIWMHNEPGVAACSNSHWGHYWTGAVWSSRGLQPLEDQLTTVFFEHFLETDIYTL